METWVIIVVLIAVALIASSSYQQYQIKENFQSYSPYGGRDYANAAEKYNSQLRDVTEANIEYLQELNRLPGSAPSGPNQRYVDQLEDVTDAKYKLDKELLRLSGQPANNYYPPPNLPPYPTPYPPPSLPTYPPPSLPAYPTPYPPVNPPPVTSNDPPTQDVCNHYAQNICLTPGCLTKQYNDCVRGSLQACDNHAANQCRAYSTQNTPNSPQGTQLYNDCFAKTRAECMTYGAV